MPRIVGVDIPAGKRMEASIQYIYGIGPTLALKLLEEAKVDPDVRASKLTDEDVKRITLLLQQKYLIEGDLRRDVQQNIKRLVSINCYRGTRHRKGLPVRGQRTSTNARTRKGPKKLPGARKKTI
ncbi:30S ribosomal protein S13 [bacterium]|nr:30S ribosomal protein S13 [bacterium]